MKYILDTNICIYTIKQKPEKVFERFKELKLGEVCISTITLAELQYGVTKSLRPDKNQSALNHFLIPLEIVNFDTAATIEYGKIRSQLEKEGQPIGSLDTLIAAIKECITERQKTCIGPVTQKRYIVVGKTETNCSAVPSLLKLLLGRTALKKLRS